MKTITVKRARRKLHRKYRTYILAKLRNWDKTEPTLTTVNIPSTLDNNK